MSVIDTRAALAPDPRHRLDDLVPEQHLDHVGVLSHLELVADQARGHRVELVRHAQRAPARDPYVRVHRVARHGRARQRAHRRLVRRQVVVDSPVALAPDHLSRERHVGIDGREVSTAAKHERLRDARLGEVVRLLGHAVFVALARSDACRRRAVVIEQRPIPLRQRPAAPVELVRRRAQVVRANHRRRPAEAPERPLQARCKRLERLREREADPRPAAEAQHELEQQMGERNTRDRDRQLVHAREVDGSLAARHMRLREDDRLRRPMLGTPVAHAALQRTCLPVGEPTGVSLLELAEERHRLQHALLVALQQRNDVPLPHLLERVGSRPPRPGCLRL